MLALYHLPMAICAQKVRVCLAEKDLDWESRIVADLRAPEYLKLNPGGYVPTLEHDGKLLTESRIISEYLDEAFAGPSLTPQDPYLKAQMSLWTKLLDEELHPNIFILTCAVTLRHWYAAMSPEQRNAALPLDPQKRQRAEDIIAHGEESQHVMPALRCFVRLVERMEERLKRSSWLAGDTYSLADADYTPYLQRLTDLGLAFLWRDKPALSGWVDRVRSRVSFDAAIVKWRPPEHRERAPEVAKRAGELFAAKLASAVPAA